MPFAPRLRAALRTKGPEEKAIAYLNEATSIADLERREREIDAGRFRRNRFPF